MKKLLAALLAMTLLLALTACGSKPAAQKPEAEAPAATLAPTPTPMPTPEPDPEAMLDPEEIEWGYQSYDPAETQYGDDAQYWYVDGDKSATSFLFFEDGYLTAVDGENRTMVDTETVDMHIVDYETKGDVFDFVFVDALTCFDLVSREWYMRADYGIVVESLTSATFVCEVGSQWTYTFYANGTLEYSENGEIKPGTWWITDALTISTHLDHQPENVGGWFNINYEDESWDIKSIEDVDVYYPER